MNIQGIRVIGKIGPFTVFTFPDGKIDPGHQWIGVNACNLEAAYVLAALTGSEVNTGQETAVIKGVLCRVAPHDDAADQRLRDMVDLAADLRFTAPQMLQLAIEGFDYDEHAKAYTDSDSRHQL